SVASSLHALLPPDVPPLSLHDALPIFSSSQGVTSSTTAGLCLNLTKNHQRRKAGLTRPAPCRHRPATLARSRTCWPRKPKTPPRSEEHTSELQSRENLVCRVLLEKNKI